MTEVKSTLAKLSKGSTALDKAYNDALRRIEGQLPGEYERAKQVLSWLAFARRPLTTAELCYALAVEPGTSKLDPDNMPDVEDLVSACAGLVIVDKESAVVRLVHHTTQDYLERIGPEWNPDAPLHIATVCLTYLCFDTFKGRSSDRREDYLETLRQNVFLEYAGEHWAKHARKVETEVSSLACILLQDQGLHANARQVQNHGYFRFKNNLSSIHFAAQLGLAQITKDLISRSRKDISAIINSKDQEGGTPLWYAAKKGYEETTKILLNNGADIHAQSRRGGTALRVAAAEGHERIVKLLLHVGARVNSPVGYCSDMLQTAAAKGHEQVVKLLLEKGAEVNAQSRQYGNALQAAAAKGHKQVVKRLLDAGAEVNAQDSRHGNALYKAAVHGHEQIVKLLLDAGADFNAQGGENGHDQTVKFLLTAGADFYGQNGGYGGNALYEAAFHGHKEIVRLLLDAGADVNAQGGRYGNALKAAAVRGDKQVVKLLLDAGAEVNAQDSRHSDALHKAAFHGHEQIVRLLIDAGADVNAQGGRYGNALKAAAVRGNKQVVKRLLDAGAEVNAQDSRHGNPLYEAAAHGHEQIVKLLLDAGADVNVQGGNYGNALNAASAFGHKNTLRLLLDNNASADKLDEKLRCPLHYAVDKPDCITWIVEQLLDHGGLVSTADHRNMTPLHYSVKHRHKLVAQILLNRGVDINSGVSRKKMTGKNVDYGSGSTERAAGLLQAKSQQAATGLTPLHYTSVAGDLDMTEFLLGHGADPNALSENGESPLQLVLRGRVFERTGDDDLNQDSSETDAWDEVYGEVKYRDKVLHALLCDPRIALTPKDCMERSLLHRILYGKPESSKIIQRLTSYGADVISGNSRQKTPLHFASDAGDHDSVMILLSVGADVAFTDHHGRNALHYAAHSGHYQTIAAILDTKKSKSVNLVASKDSRGNNSLHYLLSTRSRVQIETVQLLLDQGLDCSKRDDVENSRLSSCLNIMGDNSDEDSDKDIEDDFRERPNQHRYTISIDMYEGCEDLLRVALEKAAPEVSTTLLDYFPGSFDYRAISHIWHRLCIEIEELYASDSEGTIGRMWDVTTFLYQYCNQAWDTRFTGVTYLKQASSKLLIFDWEVPELLSLINGDSAVKGPLQDTESPKGYFSTRQTEALDNVVTISGSGTDYEVATCVEYIMSHFGEAGLMALTLVKTALHGFNSVQSK
jgi:ankyrin repeat protein